LGWYNSLGEEEKLKVRNYVAHDGSDIAWYLMRTAFSSIADMAVVPLQDPLRLGSEARMNVPGVTGGNWDWRFRAEMLTPQLAEDMRNMTATYRRLS
jgi:4-alpha-glucanotransferase